MNGRLPAAVVFLGLATTAIGLARGSQTGCIRCHEGIEPIREAGSGMATEILELGELEGDPDGCIVCHGGDPEAEDKETAHTGDFFYPDPGSSWVNEDTCGQCHPEHTAVQWQSLMMTEAGKIHGVCWAFGSLHQEYGASSGYEHFWGNYDVANPEDPNDRLGTDAYKAYMETLSDLEPQVFVDKLVRLPDAVTDLTELADHPERSAFTYLRNQCLRCHHAVKGRQKRGDYRGMGCSSCHIPYGNEGFYEGDDKTIPRDEPGHGLVHSIQGTREAKVVVHGVQYSGIPVETCTTCHDRGKRIGVSFQGLMETPYKTPFDENGNEQPALHTKHYLAMHQDIHYQKGMLCLDCHTSIDVHSDGFLATANLGAVQIECSDCHGTPTAYPWELPLGFGDEFDASLLSATPRGTTEQLTAHILAGTVFPPRDGYLLTARGNPFGNVVRDGNEVMVHTAGGKDLRLKPLKQITLQQELTVEGRVAMVEIDIHVRKTECYTCHASWAPQCYGCHVRIDYSSGKTCFDWLGAGHRHGTLEEARANRGETGYDTIIPGSVEEGRSYLRWEDPILGVNGEQRVTPIAPGCQPSITVIGADGKPILLNKIYRTPAGTEGAGEEGQLALDLSPTQPHTTAKQARSCESCHASDKALGYGVGSGKLLRPWDEPVIVDLETADKQVLPHQFQVQRAAVEGMVADWSRAVTEDGKQRMTVGHHFQHSRPLNNQEREHMNRSGICLSCHKEIPDQSLAIDVLHHIAEFTGQVPKTSAQHDALVHKILLFAAWGQVAGAVAIPVIVIIGGVWFGIRRRRRRRMQGEG
ncbi:MAG: cytochrome C [Pirellulaceae bacterium]